MAIAADIERPPSRYWDGETCRTHEPHRSRAAAERAFAHHAAIKAFGCWKCAEGRPFQAFRCRSDPGHWHVGHGSVKGETMHAEVIELSQSIDLPLPAPSDGEIWRDLAGTKRVVVQRATPNKVHFRNFGPNGGVSPQSYTLPIERFVDLYRPLKTKTPDVPSAPIAAVPSPTAAPESTKRTVSPNVKPSLTDEQARAVWLAVNRDGRTVNDVAQAFGCHRDVVYCVATGRSYKSVTADLRAVSPPRALGHRGSYPPSLTDEQARDIYRRFKAGERQAEISKANGVSDAIVSQIVRRKTYRRATESLVVQEQEPAVQITTPPTTIDLTNVSPLDLIVTPVPTVTLRSAAVSPNDLVDALDLVIQKLDGTLPRFVTVDLDAIRALVKQARGPQP